MTRLPPRPRDALGRPLARDSGVEIEPDPQPLTPAETLTVGQQLLDEGRAFRAHEVFEARWKASTGADRELWRGLAQIAVGVTHHQRGNRTGRAALLRRGAQSLAPYAGNAPYGVAVDALRAWSIEAADEDELPAMPRLMQPSSEPG